MPYHDMILRHLAIIVMLMLFSCANEPAQKSNNERINIIIAESYYVESYECNPYIDAENLEMKSYNPMAGLMPE